MAFTTENEYLVAKEEYVDVRVKFFEACINFISFVCISSPFITNST